MRLLGLHNGPLWRVYDGSKSNKEEMMMKKLTAGALLVGASTLIAKRDLSMKKLLTSALLASSVALTGCATSMPVGVLFTDLTLPVGATANSQGSKVGVAKCQSILAVVATGDCSLEAAKKDGNITSVTHADWKANNILGVIGNYELTVRGN